MVLLRLIYVRFSIHIWLLIRDMTSALPTFPIPLLELKLLDVHSPSAIRAWNSLDSIKNARTVSEYKMKINKPLVHNIYYTLGSRCVNAILASMRMHCCQWNIPCRVGSVGSVSASRTVGREFASRSGHTKDHHKNGTNCLPAWHAMC